MMLIPLTDASRRPTRFPVVTAGGGVAYAAHVGGFICGAVTARLFEPGYWAGTRAAGGVPAADRRLE